MRRYWSRFAVSLSICASTACSGCGKSAESAAHDDAATPDVIIDVGDDSGFTPDGVASDAVEDGGAITDPDEGWIEQPTKGGCGLLIANEAALAKLPKRAELPCGAGCIMSDYALPGEIVDLVEASAAATGSGDMLLHAHMGNGMRLQKVISRVPSGEHIAAYRITKNLSSCATGRAASAPLLLDLVGPLVQPGVFDETGKLTWFQENGLKTPIVDVALLSDKGPMFVFQNGSVGLLADPKATAFTFIDGGGEAFQGASYGTVTAWALTNGRRGTRGSFSGASGVALTSQDGVVASVGVSASKMVWVLVHGPDVDTGIVATAELYASPTPSKASDVVPTKIADLPGHAAFNHIQTNGDYAATVSSNPDGSNSQLLVVQLSTGKVWTLPTRTSTTTWFFTLAMSPTELLVGETDVGVSEMRRVLRIDLSSLDAFAATLGK